MTTDGIKENRVNRINRYLAVAAATLLIVLLPLSRGGASVAHADQNLGYWNVTCRVIWQGSSMTITFASDGSWADNACQGIVADQTNQYVSYPLDQPRPGAVQCAYIYTYGGYWLKERWPFTASYTGSAQIGVRDDLFYDDAGLSTNACTSIEDAANQYNSAHGYNTADNPLAVIENCQACGGGGGGYGGPPPSGTIPGLPNAPKPKHATRKPKQCVVVPPGQKKTSPLPKC